MSNVAGRTTPRWMSRVLLAAAAYNVFWGAAVILLPEATARLAGLDPLPRYPELWQCIGMIVGVYGVGYWVAAGNPVRHWPIVLVGFLGKIFGPIGLAWSLWTGALPLQMLGTIVFNDLIWWVPFGLILWHAATSTARVALPSGPPPSQTLRDQNGQTIADLSRDQNLLLVFLRHAGCTFCREALADLAAARGDLEERGVRIALVHMGPAASTEMFEAYGVADLPRFSDPGRLLYTEFELELGNLSQLFGLPTFVRGFRAAILERHGFGALEGNGLQMPGNFLIRDGQVLSAYRHKAASDRPDYTEFCTRGMTSA